jgi:tRNA U38,U39,U40 pseudouridine synthase TruA
MSIFSKILSSGATDLVKEVGGVIDNLTTTKEEKLEAEAKVRELVLSYESKMQEQITERWKSDMQSDSFLSKNVRPMVLIFLVICTMLLAFIDAGVLTFKVENTWIELIKMTLLTVIGAYFGGRSWEKVKK